MSDERDEQLRLAAYPVMAAKQVSQDEMTWQTPALAFTAQAFLFTIALQPTATRFERILPAALALVVAALSAQLLAKHTHLQHVEQVELHDLEKRTGIAGAVGAAPHAHHRDRGDEGGWFVRIPSRKLWLAGQLVFGGAAAAIIVVAVASPSWL